MAYTTIDDPSAYFQTTLYTGNGGTLAVTNGGNSDLQPDWLWLKKRNASVNHFLFDSVRGASKELNSNNTEAEASPSNYLSSFNSDGFTIGSDSDINGSSDTHVAWQWKETADAGFDIVSYSGNNSTNRQISHSLSAKPDMMIVKCRQSGLWKIYHSSLGATKYLVLSDTAAAVDNNSTWNDTEPTSSNFTLGDDGNVNETGETYINYLFAEKKGFSKIGSYIGSGSNSFIYTGFKVGWLLVKVADGTNGWLVIDTKRSPANPQGKFVYANASSAEGTVTYGEFFSNGFGWKGTNSIAVNQSGKQYIYYAIAENPFVTSTGVPATAR